MILQVGLIPKNYLIELSQYRKNEPGGGGGGKVSAEQSKDLRGKEWYYGAISRAECDALFGERGVDGDFLIRDSETNVRRNQIQRSQRGVIYRGRQRRLQRICALFPSVVLFLSTLSKGETQNDRESRKKDKRAVEIKAQIFATLVTARWHFNGIQHLVGLP